MNLLDKTKQLCAVYNIKPVRSKGQNFLVNEEIYDKIVEAADLHEDDVVLEVGPGLGFLTSKLAKKVKRVIAVELDDKLAEVLQTGLKAQGVKNVEVRNQNILDTVILNTFASFSAGSAERSEESIIDPSPAKCGVRMTGEYKIVANLPYNITSIFLRKFLSSEIRPNSMVLMLQKEVAERICASPREIPTESRSAERISRGRPGEMSLLSVSVQFYALPEVVDYVQADCFWPRPEVDSAIIKLKTKNEKLKINEKDFFRLVKIGFSARRKMLKNNLSAGYRIDQKNIAEKIKSAGLSENCRAQELSVDDWLKLFSLFR